MEARARAAFVALILALTLAAVSTASASLPRGKPYAPGQGRAFHGVSDTGDTADLFAFADQVGAHPAVLQDFFHWRVPLTTGALYRWGATDTRGVLSLSTASGSGEEMITPQQIAEGRDDRYVLRLARTIAETGQTVYIRLMPEMNGHWNAYSAFDSDGSARHGGHSARWYKRAWRRFTLLIRGGPRKRINERLVRMGMPRILRARSQSDPVYAGGPEGIPLPVPAQLPQPRVALMWVPQSFGSPNIAGNQPDDYWPGGSYVDWVGIDIYSKFAGAFDRGVAFFRRYDRWPFVIGEYGPWDNDHGGAFTGRLLRWAEAHNRVKMAIYYRGVDTQNSYNLQFYPGAQRALRNHMRKRRWLEYAPGVRALADPPPPARVAPSAPPGPRRGSG
ncbi:MAG: hypothetical protein GEU88_07560 [Solirubrobacterales bacterium]|nr:hypothetical protein [Solirubrobacterales bacterium]